MKNTSHLTVGYAPAFAAQVRKTKPGMACWAAGGPFGATCGDCEYLGYWRQIRNCAGDTVATKHVGGCEKFYELTGQHGPKVPPHTEACRYFKLRDERKPHHREQKEKHDER